MRLQGLHHITMITGDAQRAELEHALTPIRYPRVAA
jgi:hypothetical protein